MAAEQNPYQTPNAEIHAPVELPRARPVKAILAACVLIVVGKWIPVLMGLFLSDSIMSVPRKQIFEINIAISLGSRWLVACLAAYICARLAGRNEFICMLVVATLTYVIPQVFAHVNADLPWTPSDVASILFPLLWMLVGCWLGWRANRKIQSKVSANAAI